MAIKGILKINDSWTELFNFQTSFKKKSGARVTHLVHSSQLGRFRTRLY